MSYLVVVFWVRIEEKGLILITIVLYLNLPLLTSQHREVVRLAIVHAFLPQLAKLVHRVKYRRQVQQHYDADQADRVKHETNKSGTFAEAHVLRKVLFFEPEVDNGEKLG